MGARAAILDIRISGNYVWFATFLRTFKEEKQDSFRFFASKESKLNWFSDTSIDQQIKIF
jgi:hypothetical protein